MREKKSGVATITVVVIRVRIISSRWKSQENSTMKDRTNYAAFTIPLIIQTRNVTSRRLTVNVRTVLFLMVKIVENIKPVL